MCDWFILFSFFLLFCDPKIILSQQIGIRAWVFFGVINTAKFEVENFEHNSLSYWRIKMQALLRQQGLLKILDGNAKEKKNCGT